MPPVFRLSAGKIQREMISKVSLPLRVRLQTSDVASRSQRRSFAAIPSTKPEQKVQSTTDAEDKRAAQLNRHTIDRQSDEVSLSGTDDAVAAQMSVSFGKTGADMDQLQTESAQQNAWGNPLDASPANRTMSQGTAEASGGVDTKPVTAEKSVYQSEPRLQKSKVGSEKESFAGSSKVVKETETPSMVQQGSR
ncbi:hypothetical protein A1O1_01787 [Capronia coronata CBS 617.96]|uniref:Uncharacterized protein n=1 Tax=Capronia coronata CBS 617.96 TaxID=1182541 RepID=W9YUQ3_9EURO|nr:uncharacterized protein A1O1_01787 [Capronia coronata CBS 617.96]EXJ93395.1 hypothetical protein A1O1_01787 [Capronia coronata CBS 617.96]